MAYDFLSLVNDVNAEVNEVPLTTDTFSNTSGYYTYAKRAVNAALREINQVAFEWPFNHVSRTEVLVEGQTRYPFPSGAKSVNFDSFRVNDGQSLKRVYQGDYEEYLDNYVDADLNGIKYVGIPNKVYRSPDLHFILYPPPKDGMEVVYEYYKIQDDLVDPLDVPLVPEQFRHVIVNGAVAYAYKFRGDIEGSAMQMQEFRQGIKEMRTLYQNRYEYVRSGYLPRQALARTIMR